MVQRHTASNSHKTIWRPITEERFITAVTNVLRASKQTAGSFQVYEGTPKSRYNEAYLMEFDVEYQLAKDFAFIAAFEEQAETVSAVTISEHISGKGVYCTVASNAGVKPTAQKHFHDIIYVLEKCAQKDVQSALCAEQLFDLVIEFDQARIISRLKCDLWVPPKGFGSRPPPLHRSLQQTFDNIMTSNPNMKSDLEAIAARVNHLAKLIIKADSEGNTAIKENLKSIVESAGTLTGCKLSLEDFLDSKNIKITVANMKAVRAFDKLSNYWHLCQRLVRIACNKHYRSFLASIHLQFLEPFEKHKVNGNYRYVHAEVQLITFHRQQKTYPSPRAIGTSKAACYLCDLFLSQHPQYRYSATHGVLYEFWTIPDVSEYTSEDKVQLQSVIAFMYRTLNIRAQSHSRGLMFPIQSGIYQPPYFPSATATTVCSSLPSRSNQPLKMRLGEPKSELGALSALINDSLTNSSGDSHCSTYQVTALGYSHENDHGRLNSGAHHDTPEISVSRITRHLKHHENMETPTLESSKNLRLTAPRRVKRERTQQKKPRIKVQNHKTSGKERRCRRHSIYKTQGHKFRSSRRHRAIYQPVKTKRRSGTKHHSKQYGIKGKNTRIKKSDYHSSRRYDTSGQTSRSPWQIFIETTANMFASCCGIFSLSYKE